MDRTHSILFRILIISSVWLLGALVLNEIYQEEDEIKEPEDKSLIRTDDEYSFNDYFDIEIKH